MVPFVAISPATLLASPEVAIKPQPVGEPLGGFLASEASKYATAYFREKQDVKKFQDQASSLSNYFRNSGHEDVATLIDQQAATVKPDIAGAASGINTSKAREGLLDGVIAIAQKQQTLETNGLRAKSSAASNRALSSFSSVYNNLTDSENSFEAQENSRIAAEEKNRIAVAKTGADPGPPPQRKPNPYTHLRQKAEASLPQFGGLTGTGSLFPPMDQNSGSGASGAPSPSSYLTQGNSDGIPDMGGVAPDAGSGADVTTPAVPYDRPALPEDPQTPPGSISTIITRPKEAQPVTHIPSKVSAPAVANPNTFLPPSGTKVNDPAQAIRTQVLAQKQADDQAVVSGFIGEVDGLINEASTNGKFTEKEKLNIKQKALLIKSKMREVADPSSKEGKIQLAGYKAELEGLVKGSKTDSTESDPNIVQDTTMTQLDAISAEAEANSTLTPQQREAVNDQVANAKKQIAGIPNKERKDVQDLLQAKVAAVAAYMRGLNKKPATGSSYTEDVSQYQYLDSRDVDGLVVDYYSKDGKVYMRERGKNQFSVNSGVSVTGINQALDKAGFKAVAPPQDSGQTLPMAPSQGQYRPIQSFFRK